MPSFVAPSPAPNRSRVAVQVPEMNRWFEGARLVPSRLSRLYLAAELCALYLGLPILLYTQRHALDGWVIPILLLLAAGCTALLWWDDNFDRQQLWNQEAFRQHVGRMLRWFVPGAFLVGTVFAVLRPELLWLLPQSQTTVWVILMVTYPVFSVYPQEIVFRTFFFHRYHPLFRTVRAKVLASSVAFGVAHIVFANWTAPLMTAVIGLLFGLTYVRTGSTLQAALEHGAWGGFAFTVGLGWYVFSGAIG
jgi:membrane protease YdiL (CAAX protease family)